MINVYSFQKMISVQDCTQPKNISKTSHFNFGQNYKKIVSNSKGSFDFRKFLQKNHQNKKSLGTRQDFKRNPLEEVSTLQPNAQSNLHSKAFKIRCYSKRTAKQIQNQQDQLTTCKFIRHRPKLYQAKQKNTESSAKKTNNLNKKMMRMHKFDNYQELQPISIPIKIHYNSQNQQQSDTYNNCYKVIIFDTNYIVGCLKSSSTLKSSQKQRQPQYHLKKFIYLLKRTLDQKYIQISSQKTLKIKSNQKPQIIFKVKNEQQIRQLSKQLEQCQFKSHYCIFYPQNKYVQTLNIYDLTKINHLPQNVIIVDDQENFMSNIPLLNSRHFIGCVSFSQKCNYSTILEGVFNSIDNVDIRFGAEEFLEDQEKNGGKLFELPMRELLEKVKQKFMLRNMKKSSREKKQRCQSSYESSYVSNKQKRQQKTLQNFKQKILKYLKIVGNQAPFQQKKSKQLIPSANDQFQCMTGRQYNSKTNYQVVSQLIRLNSHNHRQISNYHKKMQDIQIQDLNQINSSHQYIKFQKFYINIFN